VTPHVAVVDLGYGDAGKGTVVDAVCASRPVTAVIRFNGGAQAAHNVVTDAGRHHTFAQFGSGTFAGVPTHLSRFVVVDPLALAAEAAALGNPYHLLTVDEDALLATPWHRAANRIRERRRGAGRHGSCGLGVGQTVEYALAHADAPRVGDVRSRPVLARRLAAVRDALTDAYGSLDSPPLDSPPLDSPPLDSPPLDSPPLDDVVDVFRAFGSAVSIVDGSWLPRLLRAGPCVFEGAQGVLLDEWRGFHPYTTWSTTTFGNIDADVYRLGVVRTYTTRHGPGPLVTEAALGLTEPHNGTGEWQGAFRTGHFDAVAHRYAIEVCGGVDGLAVTHLDAPVTRMCTSYQDWDRIEPGPFGDLAYQAALTDRLMHAVPGELRTVASWPEEIAEVLGAPVVLGSSGPRTGDKRWALDAVATV
jgi:adenylosuccinate synthase